MKKISIETTTRLELRINSGPCDIHCQNQTINLKVNQDAACLVLITTCGSVIMSEQIVAVTVDPSAFLRLLAFIRSDGVITLSRDIA